jgi:hypothetical protein
MLTVHGRALRRPGQPACRDETYAGKHVVIAAGARHAPLGIAGEEPLTTSTGFLELGELPAGPPSSPEGTSPLSSPTSRSMPARR